MGIISMGMLQMPFSMEVFFSLLNSIFLTDLATGKLTLHSHDLSFA